jgi:hypothetical protein
MGSAFGRKFNCVPDFFNTYAIFLVFLVSRFHVFEPINTQQHFFRSHCNFLKFFLDPSLAVSPSVFKLLSSSE